MKRFQGFRKKQHNAVQVRVPAPFYRGEADRSLETHLTYEGPKILCHEDTALSKKQFFLPPVLQGCFRQTAQLGQATPRHFSDWHEG